MEMTLNLFVQALNLIMVNGHQKTYLLQGPMGSGKTAIVKEAQRLYGNKYNYVIVDCTQWDIGDVVIPDIDKQALVMRQIPNILLVGDGSKPMFICLDEIGKASRPVQNAFLPVLNDRRAGMVPLPEGSIVFGTTNLGTEGVGDMLQAHARNRMSVIKTRGPNMEEWKSWALDNLPPGAAGMIKWVEENRKCLDSFVDYPDPKDNPYIFHPKENREAFCTARSLYYAGLEFSDEARAKNDWQSTMAAVAGNVGVRAALDMVAFVQLADKLPSMKLILTEPDRAPVPTDNAGAMVINVFRCASAIEESTVSALMTYVQRMPKEMQSMFAIQAMRLPKKNSTLALDRQFQAWIAANHWLVKR